MQQWEYGSLMILTERGTGTVSWNNGSISDQENAMRDAGLEGWELVANTIAGVQSGRVSEAIAIYTFKRPLGAGADIPNPRFPPM